MPNGEIAVDLIAGIAECGSQDIVINAPGIAGIRQLYQLIFSEPGDISG